MNLEKPTEFALDCVALVENFAQKEKLYRRHRDKQDIKGKTTSDVTDPAVCAWLTFEAARQSWEEAGAMLAAALARENRRTLEMTTTGLR